MKKDRNCMNASYPIYPMYQPGMMQPMVQPGMMNQPVMPINTTSMNTMPNMSTNDNYSSVNSQIANLEKRVSRLESIVGNNNATYSESNFYMV